MGRSPMCCPPHVMGPHCGQGPRSQRAWSLSCHLCRWPLGHRVVGRGDLKRAGIVSGCPLWGPGPERKASAADPHTPHPSTKATASVHMLGVGGPSPSRTEVEPEWAPVCAGGKLASLGLRGGGSPCAGTPVIRITEGPVISCGLHQKEASVFCRRLGCGPALQASRPHLTGHPGWLGSKVISCQGTESSIFNCRFNLNFLDHCDLPTDSEVVCAGTDALS